jgi:hypothetical protein
MKMLNNSRRRFLKVGSAAAASAAVLVMLQPVNGYAEEVQPVCEPSKGTDNVAGDISSNHGHLFFVPLEMLINNGPRQYSIQGASGHPHFINVDEAMLLALGEGQVIEVLSSQDAGHTHKVTMSLQVL